MPEKRDDRHRESFPREARCPSGTPFHRFYWSSDKQPIHIPAYK